MSIISEREIPDGDRRRSKRKVILEEPSALPSIKRNFLTVKVPINIKKPKSEIIPPKCNYFPRLVSVDSIQSVLPDHWREEQHRVPRERASESEVQQQPQKIFEEDKIEQMLDESEGLLPRTFFPLGIDWDARLEEQEYGYDVAIRSESSSSSDRKSVAGFSDLTAITDCFVRSKRMGDATSDVGTQGSVELMSEKTTHRHTRKKMPRRTTFGRIENDEFLEELERIRQNERELAQRRSTWENYYNKLNAETKTQEPSGSFERCLTNENLTGNVIRRTTTGDPKEIQDIVCELMRKPCLKKTITFQKYIEHLEQIKDHINFLDFRKITLIDAFLDKFCVLRDNITTFDLQGGKFYRMLGRHLENFDLPFLFLHMIHRPDITSLDLSYNNLTDMGLRFIADYLSWDTCIVDLNLMNNEITDLDSYVISTLAENRTLKSLRINGNPIGPKGGEFASFLLMLKDLEHLDLGQTEQSMQSIAWIGQAMIQTSTLKVLNLSRVLGYAGYTNDSLHYAITFSDILRFSSLLEFHVQKNNLSDVDLEQLLFGLSFNKTLKLLDLNFNCIGNVGAEMLAGSLQRGGPLKAVMLSGNHIGDLGAKALAHQLPASAIQFLDLSNNLIRDNGIIDIIQTVQKEQPMLSLYIFGNPFGARALEVIQRLATTRKLNQEILDIEVHYTNGYIGHGLKAGANGYRAAYYQNNGYKGEQQRKLSKKNLVSETELCHPPIW